MTILARMLLARMGLVCLTAETSVQSGHTFRGFGRLSGAALAALLMFLLLATTTLSACHALHHALHHDSDDPGHFCLVCSFAKGQVSATEASAIPVVLFLGWLFGSLQAQAPLLPGFDYRLSPSRAPPRS